MKTEPAMTVDDLEATARFMRRKILDAGFECGGSAHLGGGLSMVEIMAVLYGRILRYNAKNPRWAGRDRFILSKGHGVLGYYPALLAAGLIDEATYKTFKTDGTDLIAHPVMNLDLGIESSNGSLGQGLSMGIGVAVAARRKQADFRTFVYLGDGECNEGSVWEAAMLAAHLGLTNLTAVIDHNGLQSDGASADILDNANLSACFAAFGWDVVDVGGHDIPALIEAFERPHAEGKPKAVVARTVKGKGVPFMENDNAWHHARLTRAQYAEALAALGEEIPAEA